MTPFQVKVCVPAGPWVGQAAWGVAGTTGRRCASAAGSAAGAAVVVGAVDVSGHMPPAACAAAGAAPNLSVLGVCQGGFGLVKWVIHLPSHQVVVQEAGAFQLPSYLQ